MWFEPDVVHDPQLQLIACISDFVFPQPLAVHVADLVWFEPDVPHEPQEPHV